MVLVMYSKNESRLGQYSAEGWLYDIKFCADVSMTDKLNKIK